MNKITIYQVFTRLFGNKTEVNKPWGSLEENGVGKFSDFTDIALDAVRKLGITHIWYTGVHHHACLSDYSSYGISTDHPAIVKGRAGSPYAIRDYYSVNPDLADNPLQRNQEFESLIKRTHTANLKVIIDLVPNHVAREYRGMNNPPGTTDFGYSDNPHHDDSPNNNFYYLVGERFVPPDSQAQAQGLSCLNLARQQSPYIEQPARWTGNGARTAQPTAHDWYETVKLNYGIDPQGNKQFPKLPKRLRNQNWRAHLAFWHQQKVPDTWTKMRDIALYWLDQGIDGFRFDMAEMVPVEFWSYLNSAIKQANQNAITVAEVYQRDAYRDFIYLGLMDYLYDKVDLYDTLKGIVRNEYSVADIGRIEWELRDIAPNLVRFLENHDEQRIAHHSFASDPFRALPAVLVMTCLSYSASMIYFGQEVGEPAEQEAGFGQASRTSIFDYIGVPQHQKWMNQGLFDGGRLNDSERTLREYYSQILNLSLTASALSGDYHDLYAENHPRLAPLQHSIFPFARSSSTQKLILIANFSHHQSTESTLVLPAGLVEHWQLDQSQYALVDLLSGQEFVLSNLEVASFHLPLPALCTYILEIRPA